MKPEGGVCGQKTQTFLPRSSHCRLRLQLF